MTVQTVTGYDLLNDARTSYPNILNLIVSNFDPSITSSVANFASENWVAKTKGSDSYDPESSKQQTIALKSTEGSTLTFIQQPDKRNWDFLSSDGLVKLHTAITYGMKDMSSSNIETYTNMGGPGKVDDVNATWNMMSNMLTPSTSSYTQTFSYIGNGYNFNVSTKNNCTYKSDATGTNTSTNNATITKYNLLNTDSGFNINLTGAISQSIINNGVVSDKTSFSKVALTTTDYKLTGANVSYDTPYDESGNPIQLPNSGSGDFLGFRTFVNVTAMQDDLMANVVPNLMNGNNSITITNKEGIQIDAGAGKDTVIGAIGNDTIVGGAGSDKLTGGKGTDTFSFSNADFYTENTNGELIFKKSADTITDFNLKDGDVLDFGDLGELSFYAKLADAKLDNAHLFYVKGSGSVYLNTSTTDGFTPTVIITLTGKPAVNTDLTDWNYPA
jgi:Ca2+-binding RTX toxin-like protein